MVLRFAIGTEGRKFKIHSKMGRKCHLKGMTYTWIRRVTGRGSWCQED